MGNNIPIVVAENKPKTIKFVRWTHILNEYELDLKGEIISITQIKAYVTDPSKQPKKANRTIEFKKTKEVKLL